MACLQSTPRRAFTIVIGIGAFVTAVSAAWADPPGRVARISFVGGSVSFRAATLDEWSAATLNYPITIGDHLWTDANARTEMQLGSTVLRLAPHSEFSVLNLDDRTAQLRITEGSMTIRVRHLGKDETLEIDTPNGAISLLRPGFYRVDVNETGDTTAMTVRHGEAEVTAGGSAFPVRTEQSVVVDGLDTPGFDMRVATATDDFESWCLARDRRAESVEAARYVSPSVIGYEDLDEYGGWQVVAEYGPVWVPRVRAEWVPYRYGHWVWVDPWGWTWVDDAPWGFAPFHYGRWVRLPGGWAWMPGTIVARPVYAPALVAFVGGPGWRVSLEIGAAPVAWFPLGPREVFVPAYTVSPGYVRSVNAPHVNVTNININVTNVTYINRDVPGAVTAIPRDAFVQARPVASVGVAVPRDAVRSAAVVGTTAPVAPQHTSIVGQANVRASAPPPAVVNRPVVVRSVPPPAPLSFASKQAVLAAHPGQPVDSATESALRTRTAQPVSHPLVRTVAVPRAAAPAPAAQPVSQPAVAEPAHQPAPVYRPERSAPETTPRRVPESAPRQMAAPPSNALAADLAARHAQERAEIEARHAEERAQVAARHQEEERRVADRREQERVRQQHQEELRSLQERQKHERDEVQKRQETERQQQRKKGSQ